MYRPLQRTGCACSPIYLSTVSDMTFLLKKAFSKVWVKSSCDCFCRELNERQEVEKRLETREQELVRQLTDFQDRLEAASTELRQVRIKGLAQSRQWDAAFGNIVFCPVGHIMDVMM